MQELLDFFPTIDALILVAFGITLMLHFVFVRITRIFVDIAAVYVSFALVVFGPFLDESFASWVTVHPYIRAIAFVGFVALFHFVLWRSNVGEYVRQLQVADVISSIFYRISIVGLFFSTTLFFVPAGVRDDFGIIVQTLFSNIIALCIWFAIPFFAAFAYHFHTKRGWIE